MAQGGVIKAQTGQFVVPKFDPRNQDVRQYKNEAGEIRNIPFFNGKPLYPIPEGFSAVDADMPTEEETPETVAPAEDSGGGGDRDKPRVNAFTEAGTYMVVLKVTAFEDVEDTDTVKVTVNESNNAPVADAGGPYTAKAGEEITFDGSGSSGSDGEITEYVWDFGDSSTGTGVSPIHTYAEAGEYIVILTVKDNGKTASESKHGIF